jgi:hypothetical protein
MNNNTSNNSYSDTDTYSDTDKEIKEIQNQAQNKFNIKSIPKTLTLYITNLLSFIPTSKTKKIFLTISNIEIDTTINFIIKYPLLLSKVLYLSGLPFPDGLAPGMYYIDVLKNIFYDAGGSSGNNRLDINNYNYYDKTGEYRDKLYKYFPVKHFRKLIYDFKIA